MRTPYVFILMSMLLAGCGSSGATTGNPAFERQQNGPLTSDSPLDPYTVEKLNAILQERPNYRSLPAGQQIGLISEAFLGTPYVANKLQGSLSTPEQLVVDFRGLDCFTYLDYVEALRQSAAQPDFMKNLLRTRYVDGDLDFLSRKHFYTDWAYSGTYKQAQDITAQLSAHAVRREKRLNQKADGSAYLPGLPVVQRTVTYIPAGFIDKTVINRLHEGDFIGIYTPLAGLDVTHVGFFIMTDKGPVLRNASSHSGSQKVVDSPFLAYVANTPGIVVLRAKE